MSSNDSLAVERFRKALDNAKSYAEVWQIVKDTVEFSLGKRRGSMMLFLDDLPLQLGAYYPVGTNNIVLNRALVNIVEASLTSKPVVNALVYNLLLHEYLHALGVVVSVYFLVESAVNIAQSVGLSQQVIGATIIALGTSLPELTLDLKSILKGHPGLAFGDIIGSSFVNITLILGVTLFVPALVGTPISMRMDVFQNLVLFSIVTNMIFWYFLSRGQIGRKEGAIFLFIYILFIITTIGTM